MGRLATDISHLRTEIDEMTSRALGLAALDAKRRFELVAAQAGGGDARLSGTSRKGRGGGKLGVGYEYEKGSRGLAVAIFAKGRWQHVEYPRKGGYRIPKRRGTGPNTRRRTAPRMHLGSNFWRTGPFTGGALAGRPYWGRNAPDVLDEMGDKIVDAWVKVMDGA